MVDLEKYLKKIAKKEVNEKKKMKEPQCDDTKRTENIDNWEHRGKIDPFKSILQFSK